MTGRAASLRAAATLAAVLGTSAVAVAPARAQATGAGGAPAQRDAQASVPAASAQPPALASDEAELWYAMERAEAEVRRSPMLVQDQALNAYLRDLACKAAAARCPELRLYLLDVPQFNASMAPNGMMLVWTGALLRIRDEAELAFVLGHEAGHFTARHTLTQWRRMKNATAFLGAFQVLAYGAGAGSAGQLGALAGSLALLKYSRDMEREADRLGFASVVAAGFAPQAGADLWARLWREEQTRKYDRPLAIFSTHPASRERLADIANAARQLPAPPTERGRDRYRAAIRPLLPHLLDEELGQRRYASSILVISELLADSPADDRGLLTFYLGEAHRRRGQGDDRAKASALYAEAITLPGAPAAAWRETGFARIAAGDENGARAAFTHYLASAPAAEDRAFVARELEKLGGTP